MTELHCPFIIELYYSFQTNNELIFIMEFAFGGDLFSHFVIQGPFNEEMAKFYTAEIIIALEYLHKKKIIYRKY